MLPAKVCVLLHHNGLSFVHPTNQLQLQVEQLTLENVQLLQPYLQLQQVLTGFDQLLQLSLGLSLQPRAAAAGETWNSSVLVYDCCEMPSMQQQQQEGNRTCSNSSSSRVLGTIYVDPAGGYCAQLLLYGSQYRGGLQQQQHKDDTNSSSCRSSAGLPAVAVGLQSAGVLGGTHTQLALGLWELCHELGHAVNFILSAASEVSPGPNSTHQQQQQHPAAAPAVPHPNSAGFSVHGHVRKPYHLHAAWLPLEVLELPSTLFEAFSMDAVCLQLLCKHSSSGNALPADLAEKLAGFIRDSRYNPLLMQHMVRKFPQQLLLLYGVCNSWTCIVRVAPQVCHCC
jgi:hypothetical protein